MPWNNTRDRLMILYCILNCNKTMDIIINKYVRIKYYNLGIRLIK